MGHSSMRAALIYQHATSERDQEIAAGMDRRIAGATRKSKGGKSKAGKAPRKTKRKKRDDGGDGASGVPAQVG